MNKFAIIILNYNGLSLLKKFLPKVCKYSKQATVYLADNCSTDYSVAWVAENFSQVKIIQLTKNWGFAEGYNKALTQVDEPYYCLLNSDVEVTENWLKPIENLFDKNPNIGIIQPKILDYNKKDYFEYAGAAGGYIDALGFPFCRGRIFDTIEKDCNQYSTQKVFWASGACFFIRKEVFDKVGKFDSYFFAHQEEIDLCWRAFHQKIDVYFCNESTVYHIGGASLNKSNPKKTFLNFRNSLILLYKNLASKEKFIKIFIRLCYDGVAGIKFLFNGKPLHCLAIIKSHFAFYYYLLFVKKIKYPKRKKQKYYYIKNIVKAYFIDKKLFFNDL